MSIVIVEFFSETPRNQEPQDSGHELNNHIHESNHNNNMAQSEHD